MECQPRVLLPLLKYLLHHTATGIVTTTPQDLHLVEPGAGPEDAVECLDALFIFFWRTLTLEAFASPCLPWSKFCCFFSLYATRGWAYLRFTPRGWKKVKSTTNVPLGSPCLKMRWACCKVAPRITQVFLITAPEKTPINFQAPQKMRAQFPTSIKDHLDQPWGGKRICDQTTRLRWWSLYTTLVPSGVSVSWRIFFWKVNFLKRLVYLAILCDLFGMVKWPFSMVKWPPTRGWKGHFESPGIDHWYYPPDLHVQEIHVYKWWMMMTISKGKDCLRIKSLLFRTPPKLNIAPEKWWLVQMIRPPCGIWIFQGRAVGTSRGG